MSSVVTRSTTSTKNIEKLDHAAMEHREHRETILKWLKIWIRQQWNRYIKQMKQWIKWEQQSNRPFLESKPTFWSSVITRSTTSTKNIENFAKGHYLVPKWKQEEENKCHQKDWEWAASTEQTLDQTIYKIELNARSWKQWSGSVICYIDNLPSGLIKTTWNSYARREKFPLSIPKGWPSWWACNSLLNLEKQNQ